MGKKMNQKGFTLLEVMIALTMFSIFLTAFLVSQGGNIASSTLMQEELTLKNLAMTKLNELILEPPAFTESLNGKIDSKNFDSPYQDYSYIIEWRKLEVPDFQDVLMTGTVSQGDNENNQQLDAIKQLVFTQLKENIEKIVWQVRVTVKNRETNFPFSISTWVLNNDTPVQLNINF